MVKRQIICALYSRLIELVFAASILRINDITRCSQQLFYTKLEETVLFLSEEIVRPLQLSARSKVQIKTPSWKHGFFIADVVSA